MITITKNDNTKIVTKGAYESFYKPLGYSIVKHNLTECNDNNKQQETKTINQSTKKSKNYKRK